MIYTDLVGPLIPSKHNRSKYSLLLTDHVIQIIMKILLKKKNHVKIKLSKYTSRLQTQYNITI